MLWRIGCQRNLNYWRWTLWDADLAFKGFWGYS